MLGTYILIGQSPVPADTMTWAKWFGEGHQQRVVQQTQVNEWAWVSTVFLGLDHNYYDDGPPLLFETMCFWGGDGQEQTRCSTWLQAEAMHREMVAYAQSPRAVFGFVWGTCRQKVMTAMLEFRATIERARRQPSNTP